MEEKKKNMNGFQLRLVVAVLLFLSFSALSQTDAGQRFLNFAQVVERIQSDEDAYKIEDACAVWYRSLAKEK